MLRTRRGLRRRIMIRATVLGAVAALSAAIVAAAPSATAATTGPSTPTATRSADGKSIKLSWTAGAESSDVVERAMSANGPFAAVGGTHRVRRAGTQLSTRIKSLDPAQTYWYRIDADAPGGEVLSGVAMVAPTDATTTTTTTPTTTSSLPSAPLASWWKGFGSASPDVAQGIATDAAGNLTVSAVLGTTVDFGRGPIGVNGVTTTALVQYGPDGNVRWTRDLRVQGVTVTADARTGDVVAAGTFMGSADFGGGPMTATGAQDLFVARYDAGGGYKWARDLGSARGWVIPAAVTTTAAGDIAITGYLGGTIDLGTGSLASTAAARSIVLADFDGTGATRWSRVFSPTTDGGGLGVASDPAGRLVMAGFATGTVNLGTGSLASTGSASALFVASYDADGKPRWVKHLGSTVSSRATAVAVAANGDVVVGGVFGGSIDFGGGALTNPTPNLGFGPLSDTDPFVARYTRDGAFVWAHNFVPAHPEGNGEAVQSLAVDAAGDAVVVGAIVDDVDFGTGPLAGATHTYDAFVARLAPTGSTLDAARFGADNNDQFNGVAITPSGYAAAGYFGAAIGPLRTRGLEDGMVASFIVK